MQHIIFYIHVCCPSYTDEE